MTARKLQAWLLIALTLFWSGPVYAQSIVATPLPNAKQTFLDANGNPLSGGKVYSYVPSTTVPKTTWSNTSETVQNTNPILLDAAGRAQIWGQGNYRQVVKDNAGNTIWDAFTTAVGASPSTGAIALDTAPVGSIMAFSGFVIPTNWILTYGEGLDRATYPELLAAITITNATTACTIGSATLSGLADTSLMAVGQAIEASCLPVGTTIAAIPSANTLTASVVATASGTVSSTVFPWGNGNGSTTFQVPDLRGVVIAGPDTMAGGAALRLTSTYFGTSAATPAKAGGSQSRTLVTNNLPPYTPSGTVATSLTAHVVAAVQTTTAAAGAANDGAANQTIPLVVDSLTSAFTGTAQGGTSVPFATIQPTVTVNYIIKIKPNSTGAGGVVSVGGMFGDIVCASSFVCAPVAGINTIGCTIATTSQLGCVIPDGVTIAVNGSGRISAIASFVATLGVGTTVITGGATGQILYDNAGVLGTASGSATTLNSKVIWSNDQFFGSGRPICDVRSKGAVGDSATNDDPAITACLTVLHNFGGGILYFPPGNGVYCTFGGVTLSDTIVMIGASRAVALGACDHDVTTLTVRGNYSQVSNITISGRGSNPTDTFSVTHPALLVNCDVGCVVSHVTASGGSNAIQVLGGGDNILEDTNSNYSYGSANLYIRAVSSGNIVSGWLRRVKADDVYPTGSAPAGTPGTYTVNAWAGTTGVTLNEIRTLSGWYIQCTQSGTTGGGAPALQVYNKTMNDGSAKWQIVSQVGSYNIQFDSGSYQWSVEQTDISGPHTANLGITDTLNYSIKPGVIGFYSATTIGGGIDRGADIQAGNGFTFDGDTLGSCLTAGCVGIYVNGNFGQVLTVANSLIYGGSIGIELNPGSVIATKVSILGNKLYGWNQHAFLVAANITDFDFSHNDCSNVSIYYGANADCYTVQAGTSDYYSIVYNLLHGVTGTDGGTGTHKAVSPNL